MTGRVFNKHKRKASHEYHRTCFTHPLDGDLDSGVSAAILLLTMFNVGQKVVCANDAFHPAIAQYFPTLPKKGRIYTIRDIVPGLNPDMGHEVACYLEEIQGSVNDHGIERGFNVERFAPLNPIQEKILNKTKVEEPEEVSVN